MSASSYTREPPISGSRLADAVADAAVADAAVADAAVAVVGAAGAGKAYWCRCY